MWGTCVKFILSVDELQLSTYCYLLNAHSSTLKIAKPNTVSRAFPRVSRDPRALWRRYKRKRHSAVELGPISSDRGKQSASPSVPLKHPHKPLYLVLTATLFLSLPRACVAATEEPLFFFFASSSRPVCSPSSSSFPRDVHGPSQLSWLRPVFPFATSPPPSSAAVTLRQVRGPPWQKFEAEVTLSPEFTWGLGVCLQPGAAQIQVPVTVYTICFLFLSLLPQIINKCGGVFSSMSETVCMWARVQGRVTLKHQRW